MLTTQKTLCVIRHDTNILPILDYMDKAQFLALSLSGGIIVWQYKGLPMLIPAARIMNLAASMESMNKVKSSKSIPIGFVFTTDDALMLPRKIADALLGDDK